MRQRGQGNFELATNYDYIHLGQLTQAKSLRKCRISKLALKRPQSAACPWSPVLFAVVLEGESQIPHLMWNLALIFYCFFDYNLVI